VVQHAFFDDFDSEELVAYAKHSLERDDLVGAMALLKRAASRSDAPQATAALIGRTQARAGLLERAQRSFEAFLAAQPDAIHERFELGMVLQQRGDKLGAIRNWDAALAASPTYPPAAYFRALAALDAGDREMAKRLLGALTASTPADNLYAKRAAELSAQLESRPTADATATAAAARRN
jgi:tetratricopeptide (TPR) repeat protein